MSATRSPLILKSGQAERHYWRDLWHYRELFAILAWRDIAVRYKQTSLGAAWAIIQPVFTMVVMTVVFGILAGLPSEGNAPYAIMVFAGILPWQFFANCLSSSSSSLVGNSHLISKVYFPRLIIPAAALVVSLVDFGFAFGVLAALMAWYRFVPDWRILTLPFFLLVAMMASLGPGLLFTALNVKYRDIRYLIPFVVQAGFYISPVAYSSAIVREKFGETAFLLYSLNPMVGVIDGFRWAIIGEDVRIHPVGFALSLLVSAGFLFLGIKYFRGTERTFADRI